MRNYDFTCVQALLDDQTMESSNGLSLTVKKVPDEPRTGYPDPRFIRSLLERPQTDEAFDVANLTVEQMRRFMGSPNRNLNTIEIYTGFETIAVEGRTAGLWRYYPRKPFAKTDRPALIFFHGGGFIGGSPLRSKISVVWSLSWPMRLFSTSIMLWLRNTNSPRALMTAMRPSATCTTMRQTTASIRPKSQSVATVPVAIWLQHAVSLTGLRTAPIIQAQVLIYPVMLIGTARTPDFTWQLSDFNLCEEYRTVLEPMVLGLPPQKTRHPVLKLSTPRCPRIVKIHWSAPCWHLTAPFFPGL